MTATTHSRSTHTSTAYHLRWPALFVILIAEVLDMLDGLIATIAGPSILRDLGGTPSTLQWLTAAYVIAMASGLLIGGRLGDIFGRRTMFLIGLCGFTGFSLAAACAGSIGFIIGARVLQGAFGALMLPQGLGMIKSMFPQDEVGKAFAAFGPVMGLGAVLGPILAGWLVDADLFGLGWRAIFGVNIPVGLIGIVGGFIILPRARGDRSTRLDLPGGLVATAGMFLLIFPLIQGREHGWPTWAFVMLAGSALAFVVFWLVERARQRSGASTLVEPSLFTKRAFNAGLVAGLGFFAFLMSLSFTVMLVLQIGLGYSPLKAGLSSLPLALGMMTGFIASGPLAQKLGRTAMLIGCAGVIVGLVTQIVTLHLAGGSINGWLLAPSLFICGTSSAIVMAPFFDIVVSGVDDKETSSASGAITSVQQIGGALGIAILGTIFFDRIAHTPEASPADFAHAAAFTQYFAIALVVIAGALILLLPRRATRHDPAH